MDAREITEVLKDVFGRNFKAIESNGWLSIKCPLSKWTHERGADKRESAGISIKPNGVSVFNCFTCHNTMPIQGMLRKWAGYTGEDLGGLIEELEDAVYLGPRTIPTWDETRVQQTEEQAPLDKAIYLDLYDSAAGHPYLAARGITDETAELLQLMLDPCDPSDGEERILFPVFGTDGELYGLSGRATNGNARLKVRDYFGLKKSANVLGAHLIAQRKPGYVLIVEGLFDYANCWNHGHPAVAVMHSTFTQKQAEIVRDFSLPTYPLYDDDKAGRHGSQECAAKLVQYVPVLMPQYPRVWLTDENEEEGGHWLKDPGEMLEEDFAHAISSAKLY